MNKDWNYALMWDTIRRALEESAIQGLEVTPLNVLNGMNVLEELEERHRKEREERLKKQKNQMLRQVLEEQGERQRQEREERERHRIREMQTMFDRNGKIELYSDGRIELCATEEGAKE